MDKIIVSIEGTPVHLISRTAGRSGSPVLAYARSDRAAMSMGIFSSGMAIRRTYEASSVKRCHRCVVKSSTL